MASARTAGYRRRGSSSSSATSQLDPGSSLIARSGFARSSPHILTTCSSPPSFGQPAHADDRRDHRAGAVRRREVAPRSVLPLPELRDPRQARAKARALTMEGVALTGAWVAREQGLLRLILLEMGGSTRLMRRPRAGRAGGGHGADRLADRMPAARPCSSPGAAWATPCSSRSARPSSATATASSTSPATRRPKTCSTQSPSPRLSPTGCARRRAAGAPCGCRGRRRRSRCRGPRNSWCQWASSIACTQR